MHPQMLLEACSGESGKNRYKIELYHNETVPAQSTFIEGELREEFRRGIGTGRKFYSFIG